MGAGREARGRGDHGETGLHGSARRSPTASSACSRRGRRTPRAGARRWPRWRRSPGPRSTRSLLFVLTQLDFAAEKAREHWDRILRQWEELNRRVPEKVDLRVAVLQYFLRSQRKLHNPAIVEIKILRRDPGLGHLRRAHAALQLPLLPGPGRSRRCGGRRATTTPLTLLMIDVDDFKAFNDTRGHLAGNVALRRLAVGAASRTVREVDVAARYGGEEFADPPAQHRRKLAALKLGEKLRQAVEKAGIGRTRPATAGARSP